MDSIHKSTTQAKNIKNKEASSSNTKKGAIKTVKILGMNDLKDVGFVYKIEKDNGTEWVRRGFFFPDHMVELIEYYESCLLFKKS